MKNKTGFAFIETIITIVILSSSLLLLYVIYNAVLNDEKTRIYYDDPAFIYTTNYVKKFLEEYGDLKNIQKNYFNDTYIVTIGTGLEGLFTNSSYKTLLEGIDGNFKINRIILVKSDMFKSCYDEKDEICVKSIDSLSYNMQKYVKSLNDISYDYYLVIEYALKLNDNEKTYSGCTPTLDEGCKTYFASVGINNFIKTKDTVKSLSLYIKSLYTGVQGENNIYYHDLNLAGGAKDNSYRYAGARDQVNNYVCFGSDADTCPTNNLYRIIGVFDDQVKLIKASAATSALLGTNGDYYSYTTYYWNYKNNTSINDGFGLNTWSTSLLNKTNLNTNYINNIGSTWANKIAMTTWKVGGNTYSNIAKQIPSVAYQNEVGTSSSNTTYSAKIGLMYASDYGFAADPAAWTTTLYNYNGSVNGSTIRSLNWLYLGSNEWTISRITEYSNSVVYVYSIGNVYSSSANDFSIAVRPVFYLDKSITYTSGLGTSTDPFRIN